MKPLHFCGKLLPVTWFFIAEAQRTPRTEYEDQRFVGMHFSSIIRSA